MGRVDDVDSSVIHAKDVHPLYLVAYGPDGAKG
jgi:hypothetical protein